MSSTPTTIKASSRDSGRRRARPEGSSGARPGTRAVARSSRRGAAGASTKRGTAPSRAAAQSGASGSATARTGLSGAVERLAAHKVALLATAVVLVVILMLYGPLRRYYQAVRTQSALTVQLEQSLAENDELQTDISGLQTTEGIEDAARERGYVYEDETLVDVTNAPELSDGETGSDEATETDQRPWYVVLGDFVFQYEES